MKNYEWTTPKGANIEIVVSQEHTEIVDADGHKVEVVKNEMRLESLKINGTSYEGAISGQLVNFYIGEQRAGAHIPEEIYREIMKPTLDRLQASIKAEDEYQKHHDAVRKAMSY